jgi:hypothetical protein
MSYIRVKKDWDTTRVAPRIHSIRDIALQYEGSEERIISRVPDVSTTGMFVNTARKYAEGAVLNLSFCLALSGSTVQARGEVRYSLPGVGIGVQFIDISPSAIQSIEREIQLSHGLRGPLYKVIDLKSAGHKPARRKTVHRKSAKPKITPRKSV